MTLFTFRNDLTCFKFEFFLRVGQVVLLRSQSGRTERLDKLQLAAGLNLQNDRIGIGDCVFSVFKVPQDFPFFPR